LFENNAHTFIVDPVPAGLAKNLKKALKEFTGLTCKVRVRDTEGKVVADADAESAEEEEQPSQAEAGAATAPAAPHLRPERSKRTGRRWRRSRRGSRRCNRTFSKQLPPRPHTARKSNSERRKRARWLEKGI